MNLRLNGERLTVSLCQPACSGPVATGAEIFRRPKSLYLGVSVAKQDHTHTSTYPLKSHSSTGGWQIRLARQACDTLNNGGVKPQRGPRRYREALPSQKATFAWGERRETLQCALAAGCQGQNGSPLPLPHFPCSLETIHWAVRDSESLVLISSNRHWPISLPPHLSCSTPR